MWIQSWEGPIVHLDTPTLEAPPLPSYPPPQGSGRLGSWLSCSSIGSLCQVLLPAGPLWPQARATCSGAAVRAL